MRKLVPIGLLEPGQVLWVDGETHPMTADQDWPFLMRVLQPSLDRHGCGFILNLQPGRLSGLEDFAPGLFFGQVEPDLLQPAHNACRAMCAARMLSTVPPYDQNNISYLNKTNSQDMQAQAQSSLMVRSSRGLDRICTSLALK